MKKRDEPNIEADDEIPDEIDFTGGIRGKYYEWAKRAKGRFSLVSDEEDRRRQDQPTRSSGKGQKHEQG